MENNIEYINKKRIELLNSEEYNAGKKIVQIKKMIKNFNFIQLIKRINRSLKIQKLSISNNEDYESIIMNNIDIKKKKIVVYSCITVNYDNVLEPLHISDNVDYILYTDDMEKSSKIWKKENINNIYDIKDMTLSEKNRYIKLNPFKLFKEKYDYAIYIDGNIQVVSDIRILINCINDNYGISMHKHRNRNDIYKEYKVCKLLNKGNKKNLDKQISIYKEKKFPKEYGMLECNVIAVDLSNIKAEKIVENWYNEFNNKKSGRDQISLPYVLWKNNINIKSIATMGSDVYKNPIFYINIHKSGD